MNEIGIVWDNIERTEETENYIVQKFSKADRFLTPPEKIRMVIKKVHGKSRVEATVRLRGGRILRVEREGDNLAEIIVEARDSLIRSLRKSKEKTIDGKRTAKENVESAEASEEETDKAVSRIKTVTIEEETIQEAIQTMLDLDHDFHLFYDKNCDGLPCVAYKRQDGTFGVLAAKNGISSK